MGELFTAKCSCGYKSKSLYLGGGIFSRSHTIYAPAYCYKCEKVVYENYLKNPAVCYKCQSKVDFYDNESLHLPPDNSDSTVYRYNGRFNQPNEEILFVLPDTEYFCPKCRQFNMTFEYSGDWD